MSLSESDLQAFARASLGTFNLTNFNVDTSIAMNSLMTDIKEEFEELNTVETKKSRLNYLKIPDTTADDFTEKLVEVGDNKKVICGIRHKAGNREHPFVQMTPNFEATAQELLEIYQKYLQNYFSIFEPKQLCFWSRENFDPSLISLSYLVTTHQKMMMVPEWPFESELTFENILDDSYYDWYQAGYQSFHEDHKNLIERVPLNSKELMRQSIKDGLLKGVFWNGQRIGLIAAEKIKLLGHPGIYFNEIFLNKDYKGKGMAKAIQRKFVKEFTEPNDFIWGTIDYQNIPSFKTALANNREAIRFEYFVKLPGPCY